MNNAKQSIPREIFKAYDIRGIVDKTLTTAHVESIGHAIGSEARERGLAFETLEQGHLGGAIASYPRRKLIMSEPLELPLGERLDRAEALAGVPDLAVRVDLQPASEIHG